MCNGDDYQRKTAFVSAVSITRSVEVVSIVGPLGVGGSSFTSMKTERVGRQECKKQIPSAKT